MPLSRIAEAAALSRRSARTARPIENVSPRLAPAALFCSHVGSLPVLHTFARLPSGAEIHQMSYARPPRAYGTTGTPYSSSKYVSRYDAFAASGMSRNEFVSPERMRFGSPGVEPSTNAFAVLPM